MQRHPFDRLLLAALRRSTLRDNAVAQVARDLVAKGYPHAEVCDALARLEKTFIDPVAEQLFIDAREAID